MLQNNAILNLQNSVASPTRVEPILYRESNIITSQPRSLPTSYRERIPIPIINYQDETNERNYNISPFIPRTGFDFLRNLASVHIQQTIELNDMFASGSSENRFTIRAPTNEAIYGATENSKASDRSCWGSSRPFILKLVDKTHQETFTMQRSMGCSLFSCACVNQKVIIWAPSGDIIGYVEQSFNLFTTELLMQNREREVIRRVKIPTKYASCMPKEIDFKVMHGNALTEAGYISRMWNTDKHIHTMNIYFADQNLDSITKAIYIATGFLLEYMYFQSRF